ncbi:MAG: T9SS type A sorting domain-containing protein [Bacteriodetes bacterium]|nr:T9SS type A sorting domain-containing protein [Bacteroidota bacterium]
MKTILIQLLLITTFVIHLNAQVIGDPPSLSRFNGYQYTFVKYYSTSNGYVLDTTVNNTVNINFNDTSIVQKDADNFLLGYHWSQGSNGIIERRLHTNMPMNHYGWSKNQDGYEFSKTWGIMDGQPNGRKVNLILQFNAFTSEVIKNGNTMIEWRPSAPPFYEDSVWKPLAGDKYGSIFGFKNKQHGSVITDSNAMGFMGYKLLRDSLPSGGNMLVLSKPDMFNEIRRSNSQVAYYRAFTRPSYPDTTGKTQAEKIVIAQQYSALVNSMIADSASRWENRGNSGNTWLLSVNLRRLPDAIYQDSLDVGKVATLKIIFWSKVYDQNAQSYLSKKDSIRFDSIFTKNTSTDIINTPRGKRWAKLTSTNGIDSTSFIIRRNALPVYSSSDTACNIALGAYFRTFDPVENDTSLWAPNPWFPSDWGQTGPIDSIDLRVYYNGGCNVAITHLVLTTPHGNDILWGSKDTLAAQGLDRALKSIKLLQQNNPQQQIRLYRMYGMDETPPRCWRMNRYLNSLLEGFHISAVSGDRYQHHVPQHSFWEEESAIPSGRQFATYGTSFNKPTLDTLAPYRLLNYPGGNNKSTTQSIQGVRPTNYDCESCISYTQPIPNGPWIPHYHEGFPWSNDTLPPNRLDANSNIVLCQMESLARQAFLNKRKYYSTVPYISRHSITTWYTYGAIKQPDGTIQPFWKYHGHTRATTGEELRNTLGFSLILGTKGLNYADGLYSNGTLFNPDTIAQHLGLNSIQYGARYINGDFHNYSALYEMPNLYSFKVQGDITGTTTLLSDTVGHDFFVPTPNSNSWKFVRTQELADSMGVPLNRIFTGMRSKRKVLMEQHDKIISVESELMKLELCAWQGKGFNWFRTCRNDDTTWYTRFVDFAWGKVKVRELPQTQPETWGTRSTFFDMTVLRRKDVTQDSIFYVGVLNRHVNPNVEVNPDTTLLDTARYKFHPTFEFDSLVNAGQLSKYSQIGSREITIPFTYRHPDTKTRLLHVQELGGTLDTVICQSCSLSSKYLPGESKIYRVTLVKPQDRFTDRGSIEPVSQHKLIAMPTLIGIDSTSRKPIYDSTHVRYHLVFHRLDTVFKPGQPPMAVSRVYYKRSKLIERCAPYDVTNPILTGLNVVWESTFCLTDSILITKLPPDIGYDVVTEYPCKYPSIVVRFDTFDLKEYVYCVYSCQKDDSYNWLRIVESQFESNTTIPKSEEIARADSSNIEVYGHPVVNASQHHNYYAFSSYGNGIEYSGRVPDTTHRHTFVWHNVSCYQPRYSSFTTIADARHPSINTYSNLKNEDECALVWQEKNADDSTSVWGEWHIYYTRLYWNPFTDLSYHELPSMKVSQNGHNIDTLDGTKARISVMPLAAQGFHQFKLPSVERMSFANNGDKYFHSDKIVFQGDSSIPCNGYVNNRSGIFLSNISSIRDSITAPEYLSSAYGGTIFSCTTTLNNPSGTHAMNWYFDSMNPRLTDSSYVLNFNLPEYGWLAHITQSYFYWGSPIQYIENAENAQLAHQPFITEDFYWTFVRRAQTIPSNAINKSIFSSGTELLKRSVMQQLSHFVLSGFQQGNSRFAIADILSTTTESTMRNTGRKKQERNVLRDSLTSDWFSVYQNKVIKFVLADNEVDLVNMSIENKRTRMRVPIDVRSLAPQDGKKVRAGRIALRNGGGDEFRFVMGKTNEQAQYYEDVYIGDIPELLGKTTTENDYVVDVSQTLLSKESTQLFVYPNPANKELLIRFEGMPEDIAERNFEYVLEFTDALGKTIQKRSIKAMETTTLDIQDYAEGIYYVRVRGSIQTINSPVTILR